MVVTRTVTKNKNQDECSMKRAKTLDDNDSAPLYLMDEILFLIVLRLGLSDFESFSRVCKQWRSVALSSRNVFLTSRLPMSISFSTIAYKKYCYLEDLDKRKLKTILPHSTCRTCIGSTSSHLILYGTKAYDFWLVNPITRHELHFPRFPVDPANIKCILVFSPSMSRWVFVVAQRLSNILSFCLAGKEACWNHFWFAYPIHDLHFFKGKIYTLTTGSRLCEIRLNPKPTITLLGMEVLNSDLLRPELASWGENLYVFGYSSSEGYKAVEVDLDQMEWVCPVKTLKKYICFLNVFKPGGVGNVGLWAEPHELYERFGCFHGNDKVVHKARKIDSNIWYFPGDCLNVNRLQE